MTTTATEKTAKPTGETGPETIDRMALERSMDRFFLANPKDLSDDDLRAFIKTQRTLRALYIEKGEK